MKTLYFDCSSGIAGDMTVAALLDLGADRQGFEDLISAMDLGCHLHFADVDRGGLHAVDFDVELPHGHKHAHEITKEDLANQADHDDHHDHHEHHQHPHTRNLADVTAIIEASGLNETAKANALKVFRIVAEAESKVHEKPIDEVHFHEVGAIDSIVDICGVAYCLDNLGIERVIASPLADGTGTILCAHGELPVPVPATKAITESHNIPVNITDNVGEMVTPTGAAIIAAFAEEFTTVPEEQVAKVGCGAGKRAFKTANVLKAELLK